MWEVGVYSMVRRLTTDAFLSTVVNEDNPNSHTALEEPLRRSHSLAMFNIYIYTYIYINTILITTSSTSTQMQLVKSVTKPSQHALRAFHFILTLLGPRCNAAAINRRMHAPHTSAQVMQPQHISYLRPNYCRPIACTIYIVHLGISVSLKMQYCNSLFVML